MCAIVMKLMQFLPIIFLLHFKDINWVTHERFSLVNILNLNRLTVSFMGSVINLLNHSPSFFLIFIGFTFVCKKSQVLSQFNPYHCCYMKRKIKRLKWLIFNSFWELNDRDNSKEYCLILPSVVSWLSTILCRGFNFIFGKRKISKKFVYGLVVTFFTALSFGQQQ